MIYKRSFKEDALKGTGAVVGGYLTNVVGGSAYGQAHSFAQPLFILGGIAVGLFAANANSEVVSDLGEGFAWGVAGKGIGDWLYNKFKFPKSSSASTTTTTSFPVTAPMVPVFSAPTPAPAMASAPASVGGGWDSDY